MKEKSPESLSASVPATGRLAGIDYGTVRIGVAVSDARQSLASPLDNYTRRNEQLDRSYFLKLSADEKIVGWVVGLPVHLSGDESQKSHEARQFGNWLGQQTGLPVCYYDERFTSALAEQLLQDSGMTKKQRKKRMDKLAAQILLASFLESKNRDESSQAIDD